VGPGAGEEGGRVVAAGPPAAVARAPKSRTAPYLARVLG
jgi:excinuclease ABC subunit A